MIGVVLCGGQSSRMGKDKGLLFEGSQSWAKSAAQKLAKLQLPVFLSVNKDQFLTYSSSFNKEQLVVDADSLIAKGPLLGLLSVHQRFSAEDLFVLACDMKDMNQDLLQKLLSTFKGDNCEAIVYTTEDGRQPLCGIYSSAGLEKINAIMNAGELKKFNMMHVLQLLKTLYVTAPTDDLPYFKNYNCPEDL